jgi:hypothetical protein
MTRASVRTGMTKSDHSLDNYQVSFSVNDCS